MSYEVRMTPPAERDLRALGESIRAQVIPRVRALGDDPRPPGAARVETTREGSYRIRVGDYRVGYRVDDRERTVTVWAIGRRSSFYKIAQRRER